MKLSVLFATFNRYDILKRTLDGYLGLDTTNIELEIVCVDNACLDSTQSLVDSYKELPIKYVSCAKPGKNAALNEGLKQITGDFILLTDDDAIPDDDWLQGYSEAFIRYPDKHVFGGAIIPFCDNWPSWLDSTDSKIQGALVVRQQPNEDIEVEPTFIWGPNMAVSKKVFEEGFTFNEDIGPNGTDYIMGSETEFLGRLGANGFGAVFLKAPLVHHQIRDEQLSLNWLKGRAERQGRGIARHKKVHDQYDLSVAFVFGLPRYLVGQYLKSLALLPVRKLIQSKREYTSQLFHTHWLKGQLMYLRSNPLKD